MPCSDSTCSSGASESSFPCTERLRAGKRYQSPFVLNHNPPGAPLLAHSGIACLPRRAWVPATAAVRGVTLQIEAPRGCLTARLASAAFRSAVAAARGAARRTGFSDDAEHRGAAADAAHVAQD